MDKPLNSFLINTATLIAAGVVLYIFIDYMENREPQTITYISNDK